MRSRPPRTFVLKIQLSQMPYHATYLAYNRDRSVFYTEAVTPDILALMNGHEKGFVQAKMLGTIIHIVAVSRFQDYAW